MVRRVFNGGKREVAHISCIIVPSRTRVNNHTGPDITVILSSIHHQFNFALFIGHIITIVTIDFIITL